MSDIDSASTPNEPKDRHEPRGRKPNDHLPPSRAREVQRAFRLRRAEHLAALEERINILENENMSLRALLALPEADRPRIGSGPTGKGKSLKEGGVPMSERVRARKEARERERRAKAGLPVGESSDLELSEGRGRDSETLSPGVNHGQIHSSGPGAPGPGPSHSSSSQQQNQNQNQNQLSLFTNPAENSQFNYQLPMPFNIPVSPDNSFDFASSLDSMLKPGSTPNFGSMFSMFGTGDEGGGSAGGGGSGHNQNGGSSHQSRRRSMSPPPPPAPVANHQQQQQQAPQQPDLLTRLKSCCHLSDSHVVNDPGLLIFATRLCQSFPCQFGGMHVEVGAGISDSEHLMLEDSWRALKNQLDPGGEADGENRINTGRMAAELVVRAAHSRGPSGWILCRYREGMSIKTSMIRDLVQGLGGKLE